MPMDPSGIIYDFLNQAIGKECQINSKTLPYKRMIKMMNQKRINNWINYGAPMWDNIQSKGISQEPLLRVRNIILTNKDTLINNISDLYGETVILIRGFSYPGLDEHIKAKRISALYIDSYESGLMTLRKKRGIGFIGMDFRIKYTMKSLKLAKNTFTLNSFSQVIKDYNIYLSFSEDFPKKVRNLIDKKLKAYKKSGKIKKIIDRYISY